MFAAWTVAERAGRAFMRWSAVDSVQYGSSLLTPPSKPATGALHDPARSFSLWRTRCL